jgi:hypothetical protein
MSPTAVGPMLWGTPGCSPWVGSQWPYSPPTPSSLSTYQLLLICQSLDNVYLLGLCCSTGVLGNGTFIQGWHIFRHQAHPRVRGKGLAPAWLRLGAEAGGKCLQKGGRSLAHGCPRQGKTPSHCSRIHPVEGPRKAWSLGWAIRRLGL